MPASQAVGFGLLAVGAGVAVTDVTLLSVLTVSDDGVLDVVEDAEDVVDDPPPPPPPPQPAKTAVAANPTINVRTIIIPPDSVVVFSTQELQPRCNNLSHFRLYPSHSRGICSARAIAASTQRKPGRPQAVRYAPCHIALLMVRAPYICTVTTMALLELR